MGIKIINHLTAEQEVQVLHYLIKEDEVNKFDRNSGSSRVVLTLNGRQQEEIANIIGLSRYNSFVIKIAVSLGGQTQSNREIAAYIYNGDCYPLARIYAYGRFIELMEEVEPLKDEYRDCTDYDNVVLFNSIYGYDMEDYDDEDGDNEAVEKDMNEFNTAMEVINQLIDLFGETGDNGQLGYNADNQIVCYDYGFEVDSDEEWGSDFTAYCYEEIFLSYYLQKCIDYIISKEEITTQLDSILVDEYKKIR